MRRNMPIFLFIIFLALKSPATAEQMPIFDRLQRAESAHFVYIYQQSLSSQVTNLMDACEDAYEILSPIFSWAPREKTIVLYHDGWDVHNAYATVFPRATMAIYAADVTPPSSIYEPGDRMRKTVFHEYTHILTADAQYGPGAVLSDILGRVMTAGDPLSFFIMLCTAPPGALAPNWYLEGLSIWSETEFVGPGRGRNSYSDMIMRMPVADHRTLPSNQWDLHLPEWPYGEAAYLYGMITFRYLCEQYSAPTQTNMPGALANSVSHSFMFNFDACALPLVGTTFGALTDRSRYEETQKQSARIQSLQTATLTPLTLLTPQRLQVHQPKFDDSGNSVLFASNGEAERDTLYRINLSSGTLTKLPAARVQSELSRIASSPDRRNFYYTRLNYKGRDRVWNELLQYDAGADRCWRVTSDGRYRFPAISPNGLNMAAVRDATGREILLEVPIAKAGERESERVLVDAPELHSLVDPVYSPDAKSLVYVLAGEKGSQIHRVNVATATDEILLDWPCVILAPAFHPSGDHLVFTADRNGVYNLYRMTPNPGANPDPVTHVLGGLFEPDFSPDGKKVAAASYDSYGFHLVVFDWDKLVPISKPLPILTPDWPALASNQKAVQAALSQPPPGVTASRAYHSLPETRMDFWSPWLTASEDGVQGGLAASFSDPTGYQSLFALGGYDSDTRVPLAAVTYSYSGIYPILTLYGVNAPNTYPDLVQDTNHVFYEYAEEVSLGGAAISMPWPGVDRDVVLTLGYQYADRQVVDDRADDYRDQDLITTNLFEGGEGSIFAQLQYFNGTAYGRSHSIEDGRYVSAAVEQSDPALGGDLSRTRTLGQWDEYVTLPWGQNHVLKLEGIYGVSRGDEIDQGAFGIGGYGSLQADTTPGLDRNITLRGYADNTQVGRDVVKASVAYRFPIYRIYQGGSATVPLYFQQLFGEVFYEGGKAWGLESEDTPDSEWLNSAGAELNFSTTLLRFMEIAPGVGVAYAFDREKKKRYDEDEEDSEDSDQKLQVYVSIKATVNF